MSRTHDGDGAPRDPSPAPRVERTADGSLTLHDGEAGQTYHSGHGALTEARHVFLQASGVARRLAAGRATHVLEVGLGTGLNLLLSADAAVAADADLHYRALDRRLPPASTLRALRYDRHLRNPELAEAFIRWWEASDATPGDGPPDDGDPRPAPAPPRALVVRTALAPRVALELALGDAALAPTIETPGWAHAVYHDAFSPDAAPALWSEAFLARLARALAPEGALVTYSVKGEVRRRLASLGLRVEKLPGPPGGKREMLRATRPG